MSDLNLSGIRKSYGKMEVLHGIDLTIRAGEFVALLGASGCGKTTLLRIVAGLETVSAGEVTIGGQPVTHLPPERRDIAMMFQSYALLPHLSVAENVRFPLRMRGRGNRDEQQDRVRAALETVRLAHLADRMPRALSGGQQQRVALARAIVSDPQVLLLDEPLSNLDARLREEMQVELIEMHRRIGLTTLFVTHDQDEALSLSDRVVLMNAGRIEQQGAPREIYETPGSAYASTFLGAANLVPVRVSAGSAVLADGQSLPLPQSPRPVGAPQASGAGMAGPTVLAAPEGDAMLVLRQEDLEIGPVGALSARVVTRVYLGSRYRYILELAGQRISVLAPASVRIEPGSDTRLAVVPGRIRLLPAA